MKPALCALAVLVVVSFAVVPAAAQTGTVTVYFDEDWTMRSMDCPGPGLDTLYVVADGFAAFLGGIEFMIDYPPGMIWLADLAVPPATIGNSPTGISMGWAIPQNGNFPFEVMQALVLWTCDDCSVVNQHVSVVPHPLFGEVKAVGFPGYEEIIGTGRTSVVCQYADMDIKPGSCPNAFNIKLFEFAEDAKPMKGGVLPVAILGSESFDVSEVDLSSIRLHGVAPLPKGGPHVRDVAGPDAGMNPCDCDVVGPDGYDDIMMRFRAQDVAEAIAPGMLGNRALTITGTYLDGVPFDASDCIFIVGKVAPIMYSGDPELGYAYPNPFNPVTHLSYFIPESQHVRLAVYDVAGRLVDVLVDGVKDAGEHTLEWDASGVASGVYFGRMTAGEFTQVRRLTVLK
jgi:hypothetical protein